MNNQNLSLEDIKKEMLEFKDLFGGPLSAERSAIQRATTTGELAAIIDEHSGELESMLSDAQSHLEQFKQRIGLGEYP